MINIKKIRIEFIYILIFSIILVIRIIFVLNCGDTIVKVGDNARDHYLPIADRLVSEWRFNGPESRSDSKVPPGYPLLLAASKKISRSNNILASCALQQIFDYF